MWIFLALIGCIVAQEEATDMVVSCYYDAYHIDGGGDYCSWYYNKKSECGWWVFNNGQTNFTASEMCCACINPNEWEDDC